MIDLANLHGGLGLGARAAQATGRIVADRFEETWGGALPRTREQLARPDVVNALIRDFTPAGVKPLPPVRAVRLPGVDFASSNCTNFLIELDYELEYEGEYEGEHEGDAPGAPRTLYVKLPCTDFTTRAFANAVGFWEVEEAFCERVAHRVPIRVPRVHVVARRGARFVLLLENLAELPGARMFINRDMAAGTTIERARACLDTFAELHAAFWGWDAAQREALVPTRLHTYLSAGGRDRTRALAALAVAPSHRKAPDIFTERHAAMVLRATQKWDALVDAWYGGALTLIHGDSHLANCFEYAAPDGLRIGMLDFQGMHWCHGIRDVQYFLINSLDPALLAEHEEALIDGYVAALARHGVALDRGEARSLYTAFAFQTLLVALTSFGLGSLTESDDTLRTVMRRSVAAIDRLGFADWLGRL